MSTDNIRQDIERIMKELIATYGKDFMSEKYRLYYKISGKIYKDSMFEGCVGPINLDQCILKNLLHKMKQLSNLNPEFTLYVVSREIVNVDNDVKGCEKYGLDVIFLFPLLPGGFEPQGDPEMFRYVFDKDPLTQVFDYKLASSGHSYVCPEIYFVSYLNGDLGYLSMASAKRGVVAYCTTLDNYIYKIASDEWKLLNQELRLIWQSVGKKLHDYKEEIRFIRMRKLMLDRKYCDLYALKDRFSKEIEEIDKLVRQYDIIRVIFPLE